MKKLVTFSLALILSFHLLNAQEVIEEVNMEFDLPDKWNLEQKAGTFDDGLVQYFYRREPVKTPEGNDAYPAAIFILDKLKGRTLDDFVKGDVQYEKSGRMSAGEFSEIKQVKVAGLEARVVEIKIDDSGYRLLASIYYFINNDVIVKLILNTIRDTNPATSELETIITGLKMK